MRTEAARRTVRDAKAVHRAWFELQAIASGGDVRMIDGTLLTRTRDSATIAFPNMRTRRWSSELLDDLLMSCLEGASISSVGCWCASAPSRRLSAGLLARGFEWGWQPHWMGVDLSEPIDVNKRQGLTIEVNPDDSVWSVHAHPHHGPARAGRPAVPPYLSGEALARWRGRLWHVVAWLDSRPVGAAVAWKVGKVAGLFDVGVPEEHRRRGIGAAVTAAVLELAREHGCTRAVLNSTPLGEPLYRKLGFVSAGWGQTFWLHRHVIDRMPIDDATVAFAEAVGMGNLEVLAAAWTKLDPEQLDVPLPCGLRPIELAVLLKQVRAARWLAAKGATLDVMSACELGWRERVPHMLAARPELANFRTGSEGAGPLHHAAVAGDLELVEWLLAAGADPDMKDRVYGSTPAGWARHLGYPAIAERIERAGGSS